ncbi:MAG: metal-dependent hydrolase [Bacilli bacterium]
MDTGTHFFMGITLGGAALAVPTLNATPEIAFTTMTVAVVASQIPDIDTLFKLGNNALYIRNHRGPTHSIPALFLWPILITLFTALISPSVNVISVWLLALIGVVIHVGVDVLNAYGTQALYPFTKKWFALGILPTIDPYFLAIHIASIIIGLIFGIFVSASYAAYAISVIYIIWRTIVSERLKQKIKDDLQVSEVLLSPSYYRLRWHVVASDDKQSYVGLYDRGTFTLIDQFPTQSFEDLPFADTCLTDRNIHAFLYFSPAYRYFITENDTHWDVRFVDLRYYQPKHKRYFFVSIAKVNKDTRKVDTSYTGWVFSEDKLTQKLIGRKRKFFSFKRSHA